MILVCLIILAVSMMYLFLAERISKYINLLIVQGILLFIVAFINLIEINTLGLIMILLETLLVKAVIIPRFLNKLRKTNKLKRLDESKIPTFYSIIIMTIIIIISFIAGYFVKNQFIQLKFFTVAISTVMGGIFFIIIHKNIFNHIVGFLIIENGAFLLSLAVGGEFPFLVSLAVLIDLLIAVLIIGVFVNKIGDTFEELSITSLTHIKD